MEQSMHLFRVFAKSFKSVSEHSVASSKNGGFNPTAFAVMEVIYRKGPQPIQQIGSKLLLQSGNVTYVIDKLEERGFLHRRPCPQDRRIIFAELTSRGQQMMDEIYPCHTQRIHLAMNALDESEKEQLIHLLKKMGMGADSAAASIHKS
ncbi:MarR family winged helix-turn-helix transcriptional regulator [Paenibacillus lacisoli]|nr:MarR family transcriptional regulator [Paenibacillus sp. JX-17]